MKLESKKIFTYFTILIITGSMLLPFFAMIFVSFCPENQTYELLKGFTPTINNWKSVFNQIPVSRYFFNSLFVATLTTIGQVLFSALAGFAFAKIRFKGKDILFYLFLISMMVPPQVNIVPLFWLISKLGLINSFPALILPGLFGGFGVYMMRQFFISFPKDIEESAKIDGANTFIAFFRIIVPLATPALTTLAIFTFIAAWNSFMWPLIVTNTEEMRTFAVGLSVFKGSLRELTLWGELMVCCTICTIPAIIIFIFLKKYLMNDITSGAIKE